MIQRKINDINFIVDERNSQLFIEDNNIELPFNDIDNLLEFIYNKKEKYTPLSVYIELTDYCNFQCPFCYINYSTNNKEYLNKQLIYNCVDYLLDLGLLFVNLSGGECLLHPNFEEIYKYIANKGILINILTNGSLLNEKLFELFDQYKPHKIEISLYASDNESLKRNTRQTKVKLETIRENIIKLKHNNQNVVCKMPLNSVTSSSFEETLNWCEKNDIEFYYSDELFDNYDGVSNKKYKLNNEIILKRLKEDNIQLYKKMNFNLCQKKKCFDCIGGKYSFVISYDGYIYPCFEFRHIKEAMFKININNFEHTYNRMMTFINKYSNHYLSYCNGCNAYSLCRDCVITSLNNKHNCEKYRKERTEILKLLEKECANMKNKYETKELNTERLIIKKGTSEDCIKVYEYDMLKCRGILGEEVLERVSKPIDFIGDNSEEYYEECIKEKMFDWYIYLKDGTPIGNIVADRENDEINSIELSFNLHPNYWRNGYMKEAVKAVVNYLFNFYDNIVISYDDGNYKSESFAKNLGFKLYKVNKNSYQKNGNNVDTFIMIISKEEWKNNNNL